MLGRLGGSSCTPPPPSPWRVAVTGVCCGARVGCHGCDWSAVGSTPAVGMASPSGQPCACTNHHFVFIIHEQGCQREVIKKEELHFVANLVRSFKDPPPPPILSEIISSDLDKSQGQYFGTKNTDFHHSAEDWQPCMKHYNAQNNMFRITNCNTIEGFCYSNGKIILSMFILSS